MEEQYLIARIKQGDKEVFSYLFRRYYKDLVLFGGTILPDQESCEDIVQSVFLKLWKEHATIEINSSLKSYLLKAVRNGCLDQIRHSHVMREHESYVLEYKIAENLDTEKYILYSDLNTHLQQALRQLPEPYREAFELNRLEGMKYREIAEKLNVSERTVEVRIGKALELLRKALKEFLMGLFI